MSLKRELDRIRENANQILIAVNKIGNSDKLAKPISALGLSVRAVNCLTRRDIKYLDELLELSKEELLRIRNMGINTFGEIKEKVKELGFDVWG
jgi:DNA-directed RNA polymerase alpha subunit